MTGVIYGHEPLVPARMGPTPARPDGTVLDHFRRCSACDVTDAVGRLYSMDSGIRPLYQPVRRAVGVALTVKAVPGDNLAIHTALGLAGPDDVLVIDWRGHVESCGTGVLSLIDPIRRGLTGVVVDGAWRDIEDIQALDFPVYGRGIAPYSPPKAQPGEVNVPVACGGVVVEPGDIVVADAGGVAVVPARHAALIVSAVEPAVVLTGLEQYPLEQLRVAAEQRRAQLGERYEREVGVPDDQSRMIS